MEGASQEPNWEQIRSYFPGLQHRVDLNTAAGGPLSTFARDAGKQYFDEGAERGDTAWPDWMKKVEDTRKLVAETIDSNMVFTCVR